MPRPRHPKSEAILQTAARRKADGVKSFLTSTALEYGVSQSTVQNILKRAGIASKPSTSTHRRGRKGGEAVRLTQQEKDAILWCPECGNVHIHVPCEWCYHWDHAKFVRAGQKSQKIQKAYKRKQSRTKFVPYHQLPGAS